MTAADTLTMTLGEAIRLARRRNRWSQDQAAKAIGVSRPTYGNWERDESVPDVREFARLVTVMGELWLWSVVDSRLSLSAYCKSPGQRAKKRDWRRPSTPSPRRVTSVTSR